jgi:hypothetical protein
MSDGVEKTICVLPFSGKKDDFTMWSKRFLAIARVCGYRNAMLGKSIVPKQLDNLDPNDATKVTLIAAQKANAGGYNELIMSCNKEVSFGIVDEAVTEDLPDGDLKKAWDNLNNKYQPKTKAALTELKSEFHETVLGNGQDPYEWISDLEHKRWRLNEMKAPVSDVDFLIHLITNLTEEYNMIVELYQDKIGNGQQDELKVEVLHEALQNKFVWLNKAKKSGADSALAATGKFKGKCSFCGKVGHKAENC